jgi:hypothetical protein
MFTSAGLFDQVQSKKKKKSKDILKNKHFKFPSAICSLGDTDKLSWSQVIISCV